MTWLFDQPRRGPMSLHESPCRFCGSRSHYSPDHVDPDKPLVATLRAIQLLPMCPEPDYKDAA